MATSVFAQRVLRVLGFLVLVTMALLAIEMGLVGPAPQSWLREFWRPVRDLYLANKPPADMAILIIGTSVPAVTGGLAILKGFYYAEIMLPKRLQELTSALKVRHLVQRSELLAYVNRPFKTRDFLVPAILSNPFSWLLSLSGHVSTRNQARQFATSVGVLDDQIKTLTITIEDFQNRKVTAHLIRAAYFVADASKHQAGTAEWRTSIETTRAEYVAALSLRERDLDALEGAAAQSRTLMDEPSELLYLNNLVAAADQKKHPLVHARAQRQIAEICDKRALPKSWDEARTRLVTASRLLEQRTAYGTAEVAEMATVQLVYGEVQTKREKFSAARTALDRSRELFGTFQGNAKSEGQLRVAAAMKRLDAAAGDREAPGDE